MNLVQVKIEILPGGKMPEKAHAGDAAWDCYAREVGMDEAAGLVRCALGFRMELPEGYFADLRPRSSIYKTGLWLSNSCGVVDAGYRGEVMAFFYAMRPCLKSTVGYAPGDRVVQMMIRKLDPVGLVQVDSVSMDTERGEGGFGSTGGMGVRS